MHALGTPPALTLSQDQTLRLISKDPRHSALSLVDSKSLSHSSVVKVLPPFPLPRSSTAGLPFGIPDCLDRGRAKPFGGRRTDDCTALVAETQPRSLLSIPTPGDLQTPLDRRRPARAVVAGAIVSLARIQLLGPSMPGQAPRLSSSLLPVGHCPERPYGHAAAELLRIRFRYQRVPRRCHV